MLCAIIFVGDLLLPVETSSDLLDLLCCALSHGGNVFLPIKTSNELTASINSAMMWQMLHWSSNSLSMYNSRSMLSEGNVVELLFEIPVVSVQVLLLHVRDELAVGSVASEL